MPEADWTRVATEVAALRNDWRRTPSIPVWSRLEPMTLTTGDLTPGAQAIVADPLWLLGRQWQYDELRGEDAGSPVLATVRGESAPLSVFKPGPVDSVAGATVALDDSSVEQYPLEVRVEAERPVIAPLRLRTQLGLQLMRRLRAAGHAPVAKAFVVNFGILPAEVGVADPVAHDEQQDPAGDARRRLASARVPDSRLVVEALSAFDDGSGGLTGLPVPIADEAGADLAEVIQLVMAWRTWAESFLAPPTGVSWNPHRLEYSFGVEAVLSDGPAILAADEYTGGTLDWYHGDLVDRPSLGSAAVPPPSATIAETTLPSPVRYAGMPNDRLFAFEDAAVYLGGVESGRTDLARLAITEFSLAFGVDWFQVPVALPYGSVARIDSVEVLDTFGVSVSVRPSSEATRPGWTAFHSTPVNDTSRLADMFVLAPILAGVLHGPPIEEVALFRDEMANLVWGVERIVPGRVSGEPVDRTRQAARVTLRQSIPGDLGDAKIIYRLMTPVPENWIPLVAFRANPSDPASHHVLERRPMLRYRDDGEPQLIHPQGSILLSTPGADPLTDRLTIAEAEVPREGVVVTRSFQLARTQNGGSVLWLGRQVDVGHGPGASGLRFDTALAPGGI